MIREIENIVLEIVNTVLQKKNNRGRKPKHDSLYYLRKIVYVQQSDIKWKYLESDVHFSTIYKIFRKWSEFNVFKLAHDKLVNTIYKSGKSKSLANMYLDSTDILNKLAYESVDYTFKYKNKKATRVSIISDDKFGIPLTFHIASPSTHDSLLTKEVINHLPFKLKNTKRKPKNLTADGGYINATTKHQIRKKANLIYPYRRNQKMKNSEFEKSLLKRRYKIENVNSWMKSNKRLTIRTDRIDVTFRSTLYMRGLMIIGMKILKHNITI
jgi:hypothetical protein